MDTLHTVLRTINETKSAEKSMRADHLIVFREFLRHLDRAHKRNVTKASGKGTKPKRSRKG
ncbi:MAG: hypothetical protein J0H78_02325 [Rhizobiales bacterium]|nr:hypothetical protein [Hyphomicrobiales bacterium]OJY43161.1 MAG: hypothetical protein BGP08_21070 [Rhizobiales bacterium 64-17]